MSQLKYDSESSDSTNETSENRIRNILTLEERVRAIRAYDAQPMYTKVAKMFNCSWEQIKNIIINRETILEFYNNTRNLCKRNDPTLDNIRKRKIKFLGECMFEYIQRAQYHQHTTLNEELLRTKALEFRDIMQIDNFVPNRPWINHFKATYNITLSNRQITLTRRPPASLDFKDIMTYCSKNNTLPDAEQQIIIETNNEEKPLYREQTRIKLINANEEAVEELQNRRKRKMNFLECALFEYMQRASYHYRTKICQDTLRRIALQLRDLLKIDGFYPDKSWFQHFRIRYNFNYSQGLLITNRVPPLSLDLRDILSYCSRKSKHLNTNSVTLVPKETVSSSVEQKHTDLDADNLSIDIRVLTPNCELQDYNGNDNDNNNDNEDDDDDDVIAIEEPPILIEIDDDEDNDYVKTETDDKTNTIAKAIVDIGEEINEPPLKKPKFTKLNELEQEDIDNTSSVLITEDLPKVLTCNEDALKFLKPLEEYSLLHENFRAIGLLSQLEDAFKNAPNRSSLSEEEDN